MLFVALMKLREGKLQDAMDRRLHWQDPEGMRVVAEYWLQTEDPLVVNVFETESQEAMIANTLAWADIFDSRVFPAIRAEDGIEMIKKVTGEQITAG